MNLSRINACISGTKCLSYVFWCTIKTVISVLVLLISNDDLIFMSYTGSSLKKSWKQIYSRLKLISCQVARRLRKKISFELLYLRMNSFSRWIECLSDWYVCFVRYLFSFSLTWVIPAIAPDIAIVSQRINDVMEVLSDFKNRRQQNRFELLEMFHFQASAYL